MKNFFNWLLLSQPKPAPSTQITVVPRDYSNENDERERALNNEIEEWLKVQPKCKLLVTVKSGEVFESEIISARGYVDRYNTGRWGDDWRSSPVSMIARKEAATDIAHVKVNSVQRNSNTFMQVGMSFLKLEEIVSIKIVEVLPELT